MFSVIANIIDLDQNAPSGSCCSGSALFAYAILVLEILGHLIIQKEHIKYNISSIISALFRCMM